MSLPKPERMPSSRELVECAAWERLPHPHEQLVVRGRRWSSSNEPSQPSLSWIAVTPRAAAMRSPSREASTISSWVGRT